MATTWVRVRNRSGTATQLLTETAPTSASDGVDLQDVRGVAAVIRAPTGQTFTGAGSLLGYLYRSGWVRSPRADVDLSDFAGLSDAALPPLPVVCPEGRFIWTPYGVALSGAGTTMTTEYLCSGKWGGE